MKGARYLQRFSGADEIVRTPVVLGVLVTAGAIGCGGVDATGPAGGEGPSVSSISVEPDSAKLTAIGASTDYSATAFDQQGNELSDIAFSWSLEDGSVATVDSTGTVTSDGNGRTAVIAEADGVADSATVVVAQQPTQVEIFPAQDSVFAIQDTLDFSADVVDAKGNTIDTVQVVWSSVDQSVADVDSTGAAVAVGDGETGIIARSCPET